jgi:hypothetical protein
MKKLLTLLLLVAFISFRAGAQMFWVENFESGSTAGELVTSYIGPNGAWTLTITGTEATKPNVWYVSCAENGHTTGVCGTGCVTSSATATGATLHVGTNPAAFGDLGASYYSGGGCFTSSSSSSSSSLSSLCVTTNRRAESPTINCTGKTNIKMKFYYIENGDGSTDDGSVWYYDGTTWSLLVNTAKTSVCGGGQGQWAMDTVSLPVSANNNPNVKIGFLWVNNDDGVGTDPSYAIDSVSLSGTPAAPVATFSVTSSTACMDSCITFTSTSTGVMDSMRWYMSDATIATPTDTGITLCSFPQSGADTMFLYVYGPGGNDTAMQIVTIKPLPHPTIVHTTGHTLSVSGTYLSYQWGSGLTMSPISGATNSTYVYGTTGIYGVAVDSGGCWGWDTISVSTVSVASVNLPTNRFWLTPEAQGFELHAEQAVMADLRINVYDATGRLANTSAWHTGNSSQSVPATDLPPGTYIVKLEGQGIVETFKWVKQ